MNAAKFWPKPTGSMIVKRTLPGGKPLSSRIIIASSERFAWASGAPVARSISDPPGNSTAAGQGVSEKAFETNFGCFVTPSGRSANARRESPNGTRVGKPEGDFQSLQTASFQA